MGAFFPFTHTESPPSTMGMPLFYLHKHLSLHKRLCEKGYLCIGNLMAMSTIGQAPLVNQAGLMPGTMSMPGTMPGTCILSATRLPMPNYPPNYIPYGHYFSPYYVPPSAIHQFLGNNAFLQQAQAGGVYTGPPTGANAW